MPRIGIGFPNQQGMPTNSFNMPPSVFPMPPSARPNTPASGRKLQQAGLLQTLSQVTTPTTLQATWELPTSAPCVNFARALCLKRVQVEQQSEKRAFELINLRVS